MQTIGDRIRHLRGIAGLSAAEVGRAAGLKNPNHVSMIERGERGKDVAASTAIALARVLGCSVEFLCDGDGDEPSPAQVREAFDRATAEPDGDPVEDITPTPGAGAAA